MSASSRSRCCSLPSPRCSRPPPSPSSWSSPSSRPAAARSARAASCATKPPARPPSPASTPPSPRPAPPSSASFPVPSSAPTAIKSTCYTPPTPDPLFPVPYNREMRIDPSAAIALYAKPGDPRAPALVAELSAWLTARGYRPLPDATDRDRLALAVVLGGDGTMLHAARRLAPRDVPVLAVHLGTLGFLTETALDRLYTVLETILGGGGVHERRLMLRVRLERNRQVLEEFDALNEAVAGKSGLARLQPMDLEI